MEKILRHVRCKKHSRNRSSAQSAGLTSNAHPEVQKPMNSQTGVSINNVQSGTPINTNRKPIDTPHWHALCATDGNSIAIKKTRIPNIFFAFATEEELKTFVYDNVNLPYLRFYYRHIIRTADSCDIVASAEEVEKFKSGQKVRIIDGKFKGAVARYHNQRCVGIIIDGLQAVCTAFVPSAFIENTYIKKFEL